MEVWAASGRENAVPWWMDIRDKRRQLFEYLRRIDSFDAIDTLSWAMSPQLRRGKPILVVRNVQPDLAYLRAASSVPVRPALRRAAHALHEWDTRRLILKGWHSADLIFALGALDAREMAIAYPALANRLRSYCIAPDRDERVAFRRVAERRIGKWVSVSAAKFLWIGRWSDHKGPDVLLRFAETFLADNPRSSLTVAGGGPESTCAVRELGLPENRLRTIEQFDRTDLPAMLEQHDVGLFTSHVEGWGLSLQEMLESGMPVFATRAGAVEDLAPWFKSQLQPFPPRTGVELPPPIDAQAFKRYSDRFSWKGIAARYLDQIQEARERRSSPADRSGESIPNGRDRFEL